MNGKIRILTLVSLGVLGLAACEERRTTSDDNRSTVSREEPKPVTPTTPSEPATPKSESEKNIDNAPAGGIGGGPAAAEREKARDRLAGVRCDHYKQCGDVAKGKKYDTMDSCLTREKADIDKDWKVDDCPRVDTPRLDTCITALQAKKCGGLSSSPSECDTSKVCIKP